MTERRVHSSRRVLGPVLLSYCHDTTVQQYRLLNVTRTVTSRRGGRLTSQPSRRTDKARGTVMTLFELDSEGLGALRLGHEADEALPFIAQDVAVLFRYGLERFDQEGCRLPLLLDLPGAAHEAVDEEGGPDPGGGEEDLLAVLAGYHAIPFGVGEDEVVVVGYEAGRGRGVRRK